MTTVQERIQILNHLGNELLKDSDEKQGVIQQAYIQNPWFTPENIEKAIKGIVSNYLNEDKLQEWIASYDFKHTSHKTIGLILAGNIPLVGIHDIISVYIAGHTAQIKASSKDEVLMKYVITLLKKLDATASIEIVEKLSGFDAVIATGSNNTGRYFEQYFGKVPNIIRKNRNAIAVLSGEESREELQKLGEDIFAYFGLGCRNVSKLYVPKDYDFTAMFEAFAPQYSSIAHHNKYKNNYDYNHALFMLNKEEFLLNEFLLVKKDTAIPSRIASIHFEEYEELEQVTSALKQHEKEIQCVVSTLKFDAVNTFEFGMAQQPSLSDYADGVDTMKFLVEL